MSGSTRSVALHGIFETEDSVNERSVLSESENIDIVLRHATNSSGNATQSDPTTHSLRIPQRQRHSRSATFDEGFETEMTHSVHSRNDSDPLGEWSGADPRVSRVANRSVRRRQDRVALGVLTLNKDGDAEPMVFDASIRGYSNPALEESFLLYESYFAPYRFIAQCIVMLVPNVFSLGSALLSDQDQLAVLIVTSIVIVTLLAVISVDFILIRNSHRNVGCRPELLQTAKYREWVPTVTLLICGISLAVSLPYGHAFCLYVMTYDGREANDRCPTHLPLVYFVIIFMSAMTGRPRFAPYALAVMVQLAATIIVAFTIPSGDSRQYIVYEMIMIATLILVSLIQKFNDEAQRRRLFEDYLVSEARKAEVQAREEALMGLLSTIVPKRLCKRLLQRDARMDDYSAHAVVVVTDVHDAALVSTSLMPADAALAINRLGAVAQLVCQGLGLDHIRSVGDMTYVTCNLLKATEHACHLGVAYALTLFGSTPLPIRSGCAVGALRGRVVGQRCIRYDVFGAALEEAQRLLATAPPRTVNVSGSVRRYIGSDLVGGDWLSSSGDEISGGVGDQSEVYFTVGEDCPLPIVPSSAEDFHGSQSSVLDLRSGDLGLLSEELRGVRSRNKRGVSRDGSSKRSRRHASQKRGDKQSPPSSLPIVQDFIAPKAPVPPPVQESNVEAKATEQHRTIAADRVQSSQTRRTECCFLDRFSSDEVERRFTSQRCLRTRPHLVSSAVCFAMLAITVAICCIHQRRNSWDAAMTTACCVLGSSCLASVVTLLANRIGMTLSAKGDAVESVQTTLRRAWVSDVAFAAAHICLLIGAALSRPALAADDTNYLFLFGVLSSVTCVSTLRRQLIIQAALVIVAAAALTTFRPIVLFVHVGFLPGGLLIGVVIAVNMDIEHRQAFAVLEASAAARLELLGNEDFKQRVITARIPKSLVDHVQTSGGKRSRKSEFWVVEDVAVMWIAATGFRRGGLGSSLFSGSGRDPGAASDTSFGRLALLHRSATLSNRSQSIGGEPAVNCESGITHSRSAARVSQPLDELLPSTRHQTTLHAVATLHDSRRLGDRSPLAFAASADSSAGDMSQQLGQANLVTDSFSSEGHLRNSAANPFVAQNRANLLALAETNSASATSPSDYSSIEATAAAQQCSRIEELVGAAAHLHIIHMVGDQVLIAGPLNLPAGQHREAQTHKAVRQAVKLVECMLAEGLRFTAGIALETAVSVLTHSEFPTFDMYGPAVSTARALMVEAPTTMCVATERVVNVYESLRARNPEIADRSRIEISARQSWRIRGVGNNGVHVLSLRKESQRGVSAPSSRSEAPLVGVLSGAELAPTERLAFSESSARQ